MKLCRLLSVLLCLALLLGSVMTTGLIPAAATGLQTTVYAIEGATNANKVIASEDNILKNATGSCTYYGWSSAQKKNMTLTVTPPAHLYDGKLGGVGNGTTSFWRPAEANEDPFWVTYTLDGSYSVSALLIAGAGHYDLSAGCGIYDLQVYIGEASAADIKADTASYTPVYATEDDIIYGRRVDLDTPVRGSKIVLRFSGYPQGKANRGQIWLTEIAAVGTLLVDGFTADRLDAGTLPKDTNLLTGVIPTNNDKTVETESGYPVANLTDGKSTDVGSVKGGYLVYALDREHTIDRLLVAGSATDTLKNIRIWVYDSSDWDSTSKVTNQVVGYDAADAGVLFRLKMPVTGRYVVVQVGTDADGYARIGELAAYEAPVQEIAKSAHAAMLPTGDNLLAGFKPLVYNGKKATAVTSGKEVTEKDLLTKVQAEYTKGTDGLITGLNTTADSYKMTYPQYDGRGAARVQVYYDIQKSMPIRQILLATSGADKAESRLNAYKLYLSDDVNTLFDASSCVAERNDNGINLAVLHNVDKTARYFGFEIQTGQYDQVRVGEVGLYTAPVEVSGVPAIKSVASTATVVKQPPELVNLLAGKLPLTGNLTGGAKATDGVLPGVSDSDTGKAELVGNPDAWASITYDLGDVYDLSQVLVGNSLETDTLYRLRWGKVYVSDSRQTLYNEKNLAVDYTGVNKQAFTVALEDVVGRYVGFSFYILPKDGKYGERRFADWYGRARIGELGVYGERYVDSIPTTEITGTADSGKLPDGDNLLAGITPAFPFGSSFDAPNSAERLTDGVIGGVTNAANTTKATFGGGALVYALSGEAEIKQILVGNALTVSNVDRTPRYQVFVSYDQQRLFSMENLVLDYSVAAGGYNAAQVFDLPKSASGTVVGIRFVGGVRGMVSLTELGVYGTAPSYAGVLLQNMSDAVKLPSGGNLLDGLDVLDAQGGMMAPETPASQATDGVIYGITRPLPTTEEPDNKMTLVNAKQAQFVYDLGVKADISHVLLAAGTKDEVKYRITGATFYFADTLSGLFKGKPVRVEFSGSIGAVLTMNHMQARYIGVIIPVESNWYNRVRIGEIGVFGTLLGTPAADERVNLIAGKEPVDTYVTDREKPDRYNEDRSGWLEDSVPDIATIQNMTDGDYTTRHAILCQCKSRLVQPGEKDFLSVETPWAVYVFHLGGTATVDQIVMTSTGETGNYQLGGVDYYVGQDLKSLFDPENRVYTTQGEKTVDDENGDLIYDADYDVQNRVVRATLDTPRTGRYVALVVTRPHTVYRRGYSQARIDEFEVFGTLDPADVEVFPETTFTDAETGCTMTLHPYHYDDAAIYNRIAGLKVTRVACPKGMRFVDGDNWLMVNPADRYVYRFDLYDKDGNLLTDADYGTRDITVTMPNKDGGIQVMGSVDAKNVLTRVLNSRTDDGVLIGENVKSRRLVRLVMNAELVDWSGVADQDAETVDGVTAWAADSYAWLWLLLTAVLLVAVLWVALRRRVR